jgi:hypothetical protein
LEKQSTRSDDADRKFEEMWRMPLTRPRARPKELSLQVDTNKLVLIALKTLALVLVGLIVIMSAWFVYRIYQPPDSAAIAALLWVAAVLTPML